MATLTIALQNQTSSSEVYAYITGRALDSDNALIILQSDGQTPYFPASPDSTGANLAVDCAIRLGPPGSTTPATIPHIAGGRIWFSISQPLAFLLNPGPALVEPAVSNPSDPNIATNWGFAEFTFNSAQLFANISYVDFVSLPIALSLASTERADVQVVKGMPINGPDLIADALIQQNSADGAGWDRLIVRNDDGSVRRILSPNTGIVIDPSLFANYFEGYVDAVYARFANQALGVDTQAQWGTISSTPSYGGSADELNFGADPADGTPLVFGKPSTRDIFGNSSGPFTPSSSILKGAIIARLAAAFNRSMLLKEEVTPSASDVVYYNAEGGDQGPTNHYSRIVHAANVEGRGYAFPFDDVTATGQRDQSGSVFDGSPREFIVSIGGGELGRK